MKLEIKAGPNGIEGGVRWPEAQEEMEKAGRVSPWMITTMKLMPPLMLARKMRGMMGFPNKDIARRPLETRHFSIDGPNGGVAVRSYKPAGDRLPVVVYFHGGGWIGGSVEVVENICRGIADKAGCVALNVDYRLAPEHKFPAGLEDCYAAAAWAAENAAALGGDPEKVFLAGDSAGGNFATVCTLLAKERKGPAFAGQILIYAAVLMAEGPGEGEEAGEASKNPLMAVVPKMYLRDRKLLTDPRVSPLLAKDLGGLPPALVITAEFCFIREQGEAYARKLSEAGVQVKALRYNGLGHAFLDKVGVWPYADGCVADIADYIDSSLRTASSTSSR
jgi:acetyl esterase/lipase